MPETYNKSVRLMKLFAWINILCLLLTFLFFLLIIESYIANGLNVVTIGIGICLMVCIGCIIIKEYFLKKHLVKNAHYDIKMKDTDIHAVIQRFSAVEIEKDAYIAFTQVRQCEARILIQYTSDFNEQKISSQRKRVNKRINSVYGIKAKKPMYEAISGFRINLVVSDSNSQALEAWVRRDTRHLLSRNESIISAAIVCKEQLLLFPACLDDLTLLEIKKYCAAANLLTCRTCRTGDGSLS